MPARQQFSLLRERRFLPFFIAQWLGAFNDNLLRGAVLILIAFGAPGNADTALLTNLSAGLFVLPFLLASATAGQLADGLDKAQLIRRLKLLELAVMTMAALALLTGGRLEPLLALLFLTGLQSALFGPVKYAVLPEQLAETELLGGNGLLAMSTFVAILLGAGIGGGLIGAGQDGALAGLLVLTALTGWIASRYMPSAPAPAPHLGLDRNFLRQSWHLLIQLRQRRTLFLSVLGISWLWLLGVVYLSHLPAHAQALGGDADTVTLWLVLLTAGLGLGALLCEHLAGQRVELGLVPLGALGLSLAGLDLALANGTGRIAVDLFLLGLFGSFYIVPLYALVQLRAAPEQRARLMAANNILNALFMVAAAGLALALLRLGLSLSQLFLALALATAAVSAYIFRLAPEFPMRFLVWLLVSVVYRVRTQGLDRLPDRGAALLVCNHVSFVDALVIGGMIRRPVRFVMYHRIYQLPVLNFVFRTAGTIPIAPQKEDPALLQRAYDGISAALERGELVCIFPEGGITYDGKLNPFRGGVERIVARDPVPVFPMALRGLWGSMFSRRWGPALSSWPRRLRARVELAIGEPVPPGRVDRNDLQARVTALRGDWL